MELNKLNIDENIHIDIDEYFNYIKQEIDEIDYDDVLGEPYQSVIGNFHEHLKPQTYIEIGIADGIVLQLAKCKSIGVDPDPKLKGDFSSHLIYTKTSDAFFLEDASQLFSQDKIDLAFIDGMHLFEFVLRDFANVEKHCHENSYILMHDILPRCFSEASRGRVTNDWTGDVWRTILCLRKYRPDLNITILDAQPTGLAVITELDPSSNFLEKNHDDLVKEFLSIKARSFLQSRDLIMHTFSTETYFQGKDFHKFGQC